VTTQTATCYVLVRIFPRIIDARRYGAVVIPGVAKHGWPARQLRNIVYDVTPVPGHILELPTSVSKALERLRAG
jgi:hypothetical protein